ncbi:MAG: hypothetical protein ACP5OG_03265 [Candidatus Nanoarchaeia archaeon]
MGKHKNIRKEDIAALVELVRKEIEMHKQGKIERFTTTPELVEIFEVSKTSVINYLKEIDLEDRNYRSNSIISFTAKHMYDDPKFMNEHKKRSSQKMKKKWECPEFRDMHVKIGAEVFKNLFQDDNFLEKHRQRGREMIEKLRQDKNFVEKQREKSSENGRKVMKRNFANPEFLIRHKERGRIQGLKNLEEIRKNSYFIEGRFYSQSMQEGAVALLLEKYISDYKIKDKENFQVRDKEINNGGIDFLVDNEFLEWHPFILADMNNGRGDIPSKEEYKSYEKVISQLSREEQKRFQEDYEKVLAINYRNKRQNSVDNSDYSGMNVSLVTNIPELYDFISKYSDNLPSFDDFKREFNQKVKYVKQFKVEAKKNKANSEEAS